MKYSKSTVKRLVIAIVGILILNAIIFYNIGYRQSKVDTAHKYPIYNLKKEVFSDAELEDGTIYFMGGASHKWTVYTPEWTVYTYEADSLIFLMTYHPMTNVVLDKDIAPR